MEESPTLKTKAIGPSKMVANFNLIMWHHLPVTSFEPPLSCVSDDSVPIFPFPSNRNNKINRDEQDNEILKACKGIYGVTSTDAFTYYCVY
jgi:hypothetical protein